MQEWQPERGAQTAEQDQPDEYTIPVDDQDWPMLVQLCGEVYQAKGHAGAYQWIEILLEPYRSEMWRVLEGLDVPEWLQEQNDYREQDEQPSPRRQHPDRQSGRVPPLG